MGWVMHPMTALVGDFIEIGANTMTLAVGFAAAVGYLKNRKKISLVVRLYLNNHFNQRARKIKENIQKLDALDFNDKAQRPEIVRLLHALRGQLRPWVDERKSFKAPYDRLDAIIEKRSKLSEATKSEIAHELDEIVEGVFLSDLKEADEKPGVSR